MAKTFRAPQEIFDLFKASPSMSLSRAAVWVDSMSKEIAIGDTVITPGEEDGEDDAWVKGAQVKR